MKRLCTWIPGLLIVGACGGGGTGESGDNDEASVTGGPSATEGAGGGGAGQWSGGTGGELATGGGGGSVATGGTGATSGGSDDPACLTHSEDGGFGLCPVDDEDNDTITDAVDLPAVSDCDEDEFQVSDISSCDDVDFFRFTGTDALLCIVNPTAYFTPQPYSLLRDSWVDLCLFADCLHGETEVDCVDGVPGREGDLDGCCGGSVELSISCSGGSSDADVYLRVSHEGSEQECMAYDINLHF